MKFSFSTVVTLITVLLSMSAESTSLRGGFMNHEDGTDINQRALYPHVSVKNDTPYEVNSIRVEYSACADDDNNFIASAGTWTAGTYRGGCLVTDIHSTLILNDGTGRVLECASYWSGGTGYSEFFIMWIDGDCCLRSSYQSNTECTKQTNDDYPPAGMW